MSSSPLVQMISEALREGIRQGKFPAGRSLPSERQLCEEFAVSRATLRQAILKLGNEGVLIRKHHCQPIVASRETTITGVSTRSRYIALWLWPATEDYGASLIVKGVQRALNGSHYRLYIPNAVGDDWDVLIKREQEFFENTAYDQDAIGVIAWCVGGENNRSALERLREMNVPVVFIDRLPYEGSDGDYVGTENVISSQSVIEHMLDHGHRRIGYISNTESASTIKDRLKGYEFALADAGIPFDPNLVGYVGSTSRVSAQVGADIVVAQLLENPNPPTAIACVNDHITLLVMESLKRRGLHIPTDISIAGFDGMLRWMPGGGHFTSAYQSFLRIGEVAAKLLLERIESQRLNHHSYRHVLLDAPLHDKGSVARID